MEEKDQPMPNLARPTKWTLLLVGDNHGCVGPHGSKWESHPAHYERVDVCEVSAANAVAPGEPRKALYWAAIDCAHSITDDTIVLHRDPSKDGNALSQLGDRLEAAVPPLTAPAPQTDELRKVVSAHCNDLTGCAWTLRGAGGFEATALEILKAVAELRAAMDAAPQQSAEVPPIVMGVDLSRDGIAMVRDQALADAISECDIVMLGVDTPEEYVGALNCREAIRALRTAASNTEKASDVRPLTRCAANRDGECRHAQCPQLRDNEPAATGRHCPLDNENDED
jgi:hypothetical protein